MRRVVIDPTFAGWRAGARRLLEEGVEPREIVWEERGGAQGALEGLWEGDADSPSPDAMRAEDSAPGDTGARPSRFRVPRAFVEVGEAAACHRWPERWGLLYRVLWRVTHGEPKLMEVAVDPDVHRLRAMEKAVGRDVHKLHAFVRFRALEHEGETHYVAWFEPEHLIVERATPFFERRFPSMRWSVLTPDRCAHWDGHLLRFTPGVSRSAAPDADELESLWRTYYASTFNPARLRPGAMRSEMPRKYWKNLPEAELIPGLVHDAPARVRRMIEEQLREKPEKPRRGKRSA